MISFIPFLYEKIRQNKQEELLPLYIEEAPYFESSEQEEQIETPRVIIIDIM